MNKLIKIFSVVVLSSAIVLPSIEAQDFYYCAPAPVQTVTPGGCHWDRGCVGSCKVTTLDNGSSCSFGSLCTNCSANGTGGGILRLTYAACYDDGDCVCDTDNMTPPTIIGRPTVSICKNKDIC